MNPHDWEPVILRKNTVTPVSSIHKKQLVHNEKVIDVMNDTVKKKIIASESLQELVNRRSVLSLTQKQADTKCNFPVNTIRDIEGKHCVPTEKQQNILQKVLGVQLKVITLK